MKVRLPNSGGAGNMNQMLKQAQKMQADMAELQAEKQHSAWPTAFWSSRPSAPKNLPRRLSTRGVKYISAASVRG